VKEHGSPANPQRGLPTPPTAKVVPHTRVHLGHTLVDPYAWLQDPDDPDVLAYLQAENAYARAVLQPTEPLQERLVQEMRARIVEEDCTAPQVRGEYFYYIRYRADEQYRVFCRKHRSLEAPEQVLLDENELARGQTYTFVGVFVPSPDHRLLAYAVDTTGAWVFDLYVKDLETGQVVTDRIPGIARTAAWASDNRTLFYTSFNESHRPHKLFRHVVGQDPQQAAEVHHEPDNDCYQFVSRTRSGVYLLLTIVGDNYSEMRYLQADNPTGLFQTMEPRRRDIEYYADHHDDRFIIWTNDQAPNFRVLEAPVRSPGRAHWRELIPPRDDRLIDDVSAFRDHLVVYERGGGLKHIRLSDPDGRSNVRYIAFPDPAYMFRTDTFRENVNPEYSTDKLRFQYSSFVTPESTIDYSVARGQWLAAKRQTIPSGFDPSHYVARRLEAPAPDGARVPMALVHRRELALDGTHPLLLEGYGAYGRCIDAGFNERLLSLLDRGFVYAIANVRGSNALGRDWYEQGRLMHKKNTFTDFIACAEELIRLGYTSPERLAIQSGSAGGVLITAAINLRPDLFGAVVALMPFANVITTALMPDLPLVANEYEEWGHPDDPAEFEYMLSYSPYDNIHPQPYPHVFARAAMNDLQVPYWDVAKWIARLRASKTNASRVILLTNMAAGHSGASGRFDSLREDAQAYAFLIETLGAPTEPF
jgi:oligopeptidase B